MQHLDEGTIHSWLDGALSPDEAVGVEAHVAECPQCAAAVAEARGFIAASSRILTGLDHVPRGVVPAAAPARWSNRAAWRAAAAVLVVAVGSLVVVRNNRFEANSVLPTVFDSARVPDAAVGQSGTAAASSEAAPLRDEQPSTPVAKPAEGGASSRAPLSGKPNTVTAQSTVPARERTLMRGAGAGAVSENTRPSGIAGALAPAPQPAAPPRAAEIAAFEAADAATEQPLKVVGTPRTPGAKVTLYEVAPGDTVTFTEVLSLQLSEVVTTGIASAEPLSRRSTAKSAAVAPAQRADADVAAANSPDSQRAAEAAKAPAARAPTAKVEVVNGVTTIRWLDTSTGNMVKLSGRLPEARLQQIRLRIERERAAAAAAKKNP
jgi:hypothetical protein